ncbi:MAG: thiamine phosphate synthase [Candidatus Omnitrophica bacterium]|nr:thiamine phosphate synthase [Candidatus Omnitrophota bacterium]
MKSKKQLLKTWKIYPVLDNRMFPEQGRFVTKFLELIDSPVDAIQLRLKDLKDASQFRAARMMVREAGKKNIPVIMNDRPEAALALGCRGVHLGKDDIPVSIARKILGSAAMIGRTIRDKKDLFAAGSQDYDYAAVGPVFYSPVKAGLEQISFSAIREICRVSKKPVVAIGGINKDNVRAVMAEGIRTVAFMRYGVSGKNVKREIEELRKIMSTEGKG